MGTSAPALASDRPFQLKHHSVALISACYRLGKDLHTDKKTKAFVFYTILH